MESVRYDYSNIIDIIYDYKSGLEHYDKFKGILDMINNIKIVKTITLYNDYLDLLVLNDEIFGGFIYNSHNLNYIRSFQNYMGYSFKICKFFDINLIILNNTYNFHDIIRETYNNLSLYYSIETIQ